MSGFVSQKQGGGIETAGIVEAINNMLLQSHDGVIRIFPNWDRTKDARFKRLRTVGAFLVEAKYSASEQKVDSVFIFSEKGNPCTVQSPFEGDCITIKCAETNEIIPVMQNEDEYIFSTKPGATYIIGRAECKPAPAGSPLITAHPSDVPFKLSSKATFSVSVKGKKPGYQWQKNLVDIPGATSPCYATPAMTLWDVGSEFRCIITNASGIVKSNPGVINPGSVK